MSIYALELALWDICNTPNGAGRLLQDPAEFFEGRPLEEAEQRMIKDLDIQALAGQGINQMLIMMTWNILMGPEKFPDYIARLKGIPPSATDGSSHSG